MQNSSQTPRWWDWSTVLILLILLETFASRLVATNWTSFLFLGQTIVFFGGVIGMVLGYTRFSMRLTRWISFFYMLILLPLQWTLLIDQAASLDEQLLSVGGRLLFSFSEFFARRPVEDPIFFISLVTVGFWVIGSSAGFRLVRNQNYLISVIPSAIGLLVIQSYDNSVKVRIWFMALFIFMALLLLGRLNLIENKKLWRKRRIFLSPDNSIDMTSTMVIAATFIILFSWTPPASLTSLNSAVYSWNKITKPWRVFSNRMEIAFSSLESPSGGTRGEFFGSEIGLGRGFPLSDTLMFTVHAPDLPGSQKPPRYYWRGRTYDYFSEGQWYTTNSILEDYSPEDIVPIAYTPETPDPVRFLFSTGESTFSLVYMPSQTIWLSRQGSIRELPAGYQNEVVAWYAYPTLQPGEVYQVDAVLYNPNIEQLRQAGADYPSWVTDRYLQMPDDLSTRVIELAEEITAAYDNPFDKAAAVTKYLRDNIEYSNSLPLPPRNKDPLEWMLFEYKKAYCVYYSSAEIMMLRSVGIPARMAVGFAQGDRDENDYYVHRNDAHAWPEVYFPNIGWVEFEPTGSQPVLTRPLPPRENENNGITPNLPDTAALENKLDRLQNILEGTDVPSSNQAGTDIPQPINPSLYLIPLLVIAATLAIYFGRRYAVAKRLPVVLRTTYERNGFQTPSWIVNWEQWVNTSNIQRAFESVNFALRLLKRDVPIDATPIERAETLNMILPKVGKYTQNLLDEHQTSLYTSRKADIQRARRAAINIRKHALLEAIRYIFKGRSAQNL